MILHIKKYRFEFNKFYLHPIIEICVIGVKDDIIIRPVVTGGRGVTDPQSRMRSAYMQPICIFPTPLGEK